MRSGFQNVDHPNLDEHLLRDTTRHNLKHASSVVSYKIYC